ncbi:cobyrinic acid A,C-diamide synthase [Methanobrevibacter cuticularis]|uniref:Cobyrinate a,c-diamide synthase n=1 Tax=Methanobrevibacter cuticularis TaxID=47311 RepID=A0A166E819_9EURY|nr:cobyrinate a,c-diamide synthase [Methanobrevibacter cuticularis]KZX16374.1 cobyrinic acid A,C-diamide synthase [Methanobrevibacter cuticularis]
MRIVLAGTGSAVGKTTISTGIMKALSAEMNVQPFKVGPDYIDPSYHTLATRNPSRNLDSFFMNDDQIKKSFVRGLDLANADIGIIEGVRGLYEGISPIGDVGNTASIAKALNAPVILIMDGRSLVKSAAAVVLGFKTLDPEVKIEGVILNKIKGKRHFLKAKKAIETLTNTRVIGGIPRDDALTVNERHLGLVPALERERIAINIDIWSKVVEEYIDLDALKEIAKSQGKITKSNKNNNCDENIDNNIATKYNNLNNGNNNEDIRDNIRNNENSTELWKIANKNKVKIGVARDEIFSFYYQENLESLEDNNAKIILFSPYKDEEIPDVDALYIGGGYPEIFKKELENNETMRKSINDFHRDENPIYAECGGLIYLSQSIDDVKMCNVLPYNSIMTDKVQGLSYVIAKSNEDNLISQKGEVFRGHEFHYTKLLVDDVQSNFVFDIQRGRGILNNKDGLAINNTLANYIHIHACSCPNFAYNFTKNVSEL